jgi:competence protein ComEC
MSNGMAFEFLDTGMGDGTLVEFPPWGSGPLWLVDFGERGSPFKVASRDATAFLVQRISDNAKARNLPGPFLDCLCITHADGDHWNKMGWLINGETDVTSKMWEAQGWGAGTKLKIDTLVFGGSWNKDYYRRDSALANLIWTQSKSYWPLADKDHDKPNDFGYVAPRWTVNKGNSDLESYVYLLSSNLPSKGASGDCNTKSLVLMFRYKSRKMLLTGDAGSKLVEPQILKWYRDDSINFLPCFGLKLGHHGSKASSSQAFLDEVKPAAVFASGDRRWGHPYCQPIERAQSVGNLGTISKHWYSCTKTGGDTDYDSNATTEAICTNLWYVVTTKPGITLTWPNGTKSFEPVGTYTGVQWVVQFEADDTVYFNHTKQWPGA